MQLLIPSHNNNFMFLILVHVTHFDDACSTSSGCIAEGLTPFLEGQIESDHDNILLLVGNYLNFHAEWILV